MGLGGHGGGDGPAEGAVAKMGPVLFWSGALAVAAITLTIGNKWIMLDFSFPLSLLLVQNTTAAVVILVSVLLKLGGAKFEKFTFQQVLIVFGSAFVSTVQLAASLIALPHVSIATLTVFSNMRALIQSAMEFCLLGERFGWREFAALGLIAGSSIFYSAGDKTSSIVGMIWLIINCMAYVVLGLYKRFFYNKIKQTDAGIGFTENVLTIPFILAICVATGEVPLLKMMGIDMALIPGMAVHVKTPWQAAADAKIITKMLIVGTSLFAASMNIVYINLFRNVSATSVTVLSNMNKVISITMAVFLFHKVLPPLQILALAIVMFAGVWFGMERKKTRAKQKAAAKEAAAAAEIEMAENGDADDDEDDMRPLQESDSDED